MIFERGGRRVGNDDGNMIEIEICVPMNPVLMNDRNVGYPCNHSGCESMLLHCLD